MPARLVVVYGASGYTGRLVCEYLREYGLPFVAAGRDGAAIEAALRKVPGIETANYEIAEVTHEPDALRALLRGRRVVCNTVGPFAYLGEAVVRAAAEAGTSYLDTTGEQEWIARMAAAYGSAFAEARTLLAPSTAYMHTLCEIAVRRVVETPGIDTIDASCIAAGTPTYASTQTIFAMFDSLSTTSPTASSCPGKRRGPGTSPRLTAVPACWAIPGAGAACRSSSRTTRACAACAC